MKITQKIMMAALIANVLSGSAYAVYDADNQDTTRVSDLKGVGLVSSKMLSITRAGIDAVLDERFDSSKGANDNAKNAKTFLKGIVDGTVDKFAGADEPSKKATFLAALDMALAGAYPLELDITVAGFNPGAPTRGDQITVVSDMLFAAIAPVDPREDLLRHAHTLRITSRNTYGETAADLLYELSTAAGAHREAVLARVDSLSFGKTSYKTLADKVAARLAKHAPGGQYENMQLYGDDVRIGAFHAHLEQAKRKGMAAAKQTQLSSKATAKPRPSDSDDEDRLPLFD